MVVLSLMILGLAITLAPFTIVAFILLVNSSRGLRKGAALILGWTACLVVVIAATLLITENNPPRAKTVPSTAALVAKALLGAALIWYAFRHRRRIQRMGHSRKQPGWMARIDRMSLWTAAGLGAFLQPWSLVALGVATIVQAKLSTIGSWITLVLFCLLATSSFLTMELYATFRPEAAQGRFRQVQHWIETHTDQAIVIGALVLGAWFLGSSLYLIVSS